MQKTCSSQSRKPHVQTYQCLPRMTPRQLRPSLGGSPRIFAIPPAVPISAAKVEPAAEPKQIRRKATTKRETREIPVSQFGRVRTLTSYGMTRAQVAELYGVAVDEIDWIIRRPSWRLKSWRERDRQGGTGAGRR